MAVSVTKIVPYKLINVILIEVTLCDGLLLVTFHNLTIMIKASDVSKMCCRIGTLGGCMRWILSTIHRKKYN